MLLRSWLWLAHERRHRAGWVMGSWGLCRGVDVPSLLWRERKIKP